MGDEEGGRTMPFDLGVETSNMSGRRALEKRGGREGQGVPESMLGL